MPRLIYIERFEDTAFDTLVIEPGTDYFVFLSHMGYGSHANAFSSRVEKKLARAFNNYDGASVLMAFMFRVLDADDAFEREYAKAFMIETRIGDVHNASFPAVMALEHPMGHRIDKPIVVPTRQPWSVRLLALENVAARLGVRAVRISVTGLVTRPDDPKRRKTADPEAVLPSDHGDHRP
jgi:hypothetical protein